MTTKKQLMGLISRYYSIWRSNNAAYEDWAKARGLSFNSVMVFYSLMEDREGCTQKAISRKWSIPKQTVSMVLKDFERRGLVTFAPYRNDRRNKIIRLTEEGERCAEKLITELHEQEISVLADFGAERLARMAEDLGCFTQLFIRKGQRKE